MDVYLGSRAVAISRGGETLLSEAVADVDAGRQLLQAWLIRTAARQQLHVWLSGGLCRALRMAPIPGLASEVELRRIAPEIASRQVGLNSPCHVWLDRGKLADARVCAVVETRTVDGVLGMLKAAGGHRVLSIRPWWAEVLRAALARSPQACAVATHDCDSLTVLSGRAGAFEMATTLSPLVGRDAADAAWARIRLSVDADHGPPVLVRLVPGGTRADRAAPEIAMAPLAELAS